MHCTRTSTEIALRAVDRREFLSLASAGLLGTVLVACGSSGGPAATAPPATTKAPSGPTAPPNDPRIFYKRVPWLEESPLAEVRGLLTPNELHFVRWHGAGSTVTEREYRLSVEGKVVQQLTLGVDDLKKLPSRSVIAVIQCAGEGRGYFPKAPAVTGTPWHYGAASCAEWTGVPLMTVLEMAKVDPSTTMVVYQGGDDLKVTRGIPLEKAMDPDTILAYAQNGAPVTQQNGFPVRIVVPGWVGVANVKVPVRIIAVESLDDLDADTRSKYNAFTVAQYTYQGPDYPDKSPIVYQKVISAIARPTGGTIVQPGKVLVQGYAWSGTGTIIKVEVSVDGGDWRAADSLAPQVQHSWQPWQFTWESTAGQHTLRSRATDNAGNTQPAPSEIKFNSLGYGFNGTVDLPVTVA